MKRSVDSILTTHAGSLPRPDALRDAWSKPIETPEGVATLDALLRQSVMTVVADQAMAGITIPNGSPPLLESLSALTTRRAARPAAAGCRRGWSGSNRRCVSFASSAHPLQDLDPRYRGS